MDGEWVGDSEEEARTERSRETAAAGRMTDEVTLYTFLFGASLPTVPKLVKWKSN